MPDLVVVGSANADLVVAVERRPAPGETVLGGDLSTVPGGKGANQAVAAARLGAAVTFVGCVGDDGHGELLRASMSAAGVDVARLRTVATPTGVALITVTPDGDNSIIVSPGANRLVCDDDVRAATEEIRAARALVLQLELPLPVVMCAAEVARASGTRVVLNLAPAVAVPADLLEACDPLVLNEHEGAVLLGRTRAVTTASEASDLLALGPRSVVVTLGAAGALVADATGTAHLPAAPVDAVDTTGAGDAFTAALAFRLAQGDRLREAAAYAVRVGTLTVQRRGAQPSFPAAEELAESVPDSAPDSAPES